jgi:hypothetical protein
MTVDLLRSLLACSLILAGGMGLLLLIRPIVSWRPAVLIGLSWNLGLFALYVAGNALARIEAFRAVWPWWIGGFFLAACIAAFIMRKTRPQWDSDEKPLASQTARILVGVCLGFLCLKALLVLCLLIQLPVIDSDAANLNRWVGLAKSFAFQGTMEDMGAIAKDRISPSLIPAFVAGYLSRWRDSLVCLPWFFTWLSILAMVWGTVKSYTQNSFWACGAVFLFASVPLSITHVIRPGFSDLLLSGFIVSAVSAFLLAMYQRRDFSLRSWALQLMPLCAGVLTKNEGAVWAIWIIMIAVSFDLTCHRGISWQKLSTVLVGAGVAAALAYYFLHGLIRSSFTDSRIRLLFKLRQSDRAFWMFYRTFFASNGFNLLYWILFGVSLGLFFRIRNAGDRALLIFSLLPFFFVFFFCCFTLNVLATEVGTDTGRLLLPLQAFVLPLFPVAWNAWRNNCGLR